MLTSFLIFVADRAPQPLARGAAFILGFLEGRGDVGMTWDDARSARSVA